MRHYFYIMSLVSIVVIQLIGLFWSQIHWAYVVVGPLILLGCYDIVQRKHTILRNFPLLGHFRYFFELIRPEIHQYFIESDVDGRPYNRQERSIIYQRAKHVLDTLPYGTRKHVGDIGYQWINHSLNAKPPAQTPNRVTVGNAQCAQPYDASILNISAMSFGALSKNAVMALNRGAKTGQFYQNTGEGGLTQYHTHYGGDIVMQVGTAYFGCRTYDGQFCEKTFAEKATLPSVKMIEIKLSQGAKPGHGGVLPAAKLTHEIAEIRHVCMGKDVLSPPTHSTFDSPLTLLAFIEKLRTLSGGKPIGFKLCVGERCEFLSFCKAMLEKKIYPDFITVDGGEGGTGAAPMEFSNGVGTPLSDGLVFVHNALVGCGLRDQIRIICSGKLSTGFDVVSALAMGADICNMARPMMMSIGCIQSLQCNTNRCPTGVTTQDPALIKGLVIADKYKRVAHFHDLTVRSVLELVGAAGLDCHAKLKPHHVFRRISPTEVKRLDEIYDYIAPNALLGENCPESFKRDWEMACPKNFNKARALSCDPI